MNARQAVVTAAAALALGFTGCSGERFEYEDTAPVEPDAGDAGSAFTFDPVCNPVGWDWDCLLPFPSDHFRLDDAAMPGQKRVVLPAAGVPQFDGQKAFLPTATHAADGFSIMPQLLAVFPSGVDPALLTRHDGDLAKTLTPTSTTLILDATTGEPVAHFAELDPAPEANTRRALIIRPLSVLRHGRRYVVGIQGLARADGLTVVVPERFEAIKSGDTGGDATLEATAARYERDVFPVLSTFGVDKRALQLAWDFTTASEANLTGDMLTIRDDLVARLDQLDFALAIDEVSDDVDVYLARVVVGSFTVPRYVDGDEAGAYLSRDAAGQVVQSGDTRVTFTAVVPRSVAALPLEPGGPRARVVVYGHSFLRDQGELRTPLIAQLADALGVVFIAGDWIGMATDDATAILGDISLEPAVTLRFADRVHQAVANHIALARVARGPLAEVDALKMQDQLVYDPSWVGYYGISGGHLFGSTYAALSPDIDRAVLGVGSAGFGALMPRARSFLTFLGVLEGKVSGADAPALELQKIIALTQTTLDRIDSITYAPRTLTDTYPGSPPDRRVLMHIAIGDSESPNLAAHMHARALGLALVTPSARAIYGLEPAAAPHDGSGLVEWDFGVDPLPDIEAAIPDVDTAVHDQLVTHPTAVGQIDTFLRPGGRIEIVCDGACDPD